MISQMPTNPNETQMVMGTPIIQPSINIDDCFTELANLSYVKICQKASCVECLYPRCVPNRYDVVGPNDQNMYYFTEKSDCCERYCFHPYRSFEMKIVNVTSSQNKKSVSMEGSKNCSIPFIFPFGCGKPVFSIDIKIPIGSRLGRVKLNYDNCCCYICSNHLDILDSSDNLKYIIRQNSCCCCLGSAYGIYAKCCSIDYNIIQDNQIVGKITKDVCNGKITFCTKADNYTITFPLNASPQDKMLLICGAILIDYLSYYIGVCSYY